MPTRTREHELEAQSRHELHGLFIQAGWTVEDIQHDYGEDLFVRIFNRGRATHWTFFVQAKATDHIERYRSKDGKGLSYPLDRDHLDSWVKFWEPVILTIWDAQSGVTYWVAIQDVLDRQTNTSMQKKRVSIHIPITNILDTLSLKEIAGITISRFVRLERELDGTKLLVELLEKALDANIKYDFHYGALLITPNHPIGEEAARLFLLGQADRDWTTLASELGTTLENAFELTINAVKANPPGLEDFVIRDASGKVIKSFENASEHIHYVRLMDELRICDRITLTN